MSEYDYDLIVIGAGSGGTRTARISASYGAKTLVVEGDRAGGTCVLRGCIPKKLLVYASQFSEQVSDAEGFCWQIENFKSNWAELIKKKNKELDRLHQIYVNLIKNSGCDLISGWGEVIGPNRVSIRKNDGEIIEFSSKKIMIAVGGKASFPDFEGNNYMINSDEALDLNNLPNSIAIYGSGYIAVEFAGIFNGFGIDTHLIFRADKALRGFDEDVRQHLMRSMKDKGISIHNEVTISKIIKENENIKIKLSDNSTLSVETVMGATGRVPNITGLGLQELGVELGERGEILVNKFNQTNLKSIYAIGDVTNKITLTPVAIAEGHAFADREFGGIDRFISYDYVPSAVFSQPSIAVVGLNYEEAKKNKLNVREYKSEFRALKNTVTDNPERTLMKLVVEQDTQKVLGAHMIGPDAAEIIQGIAIAIKAGALKSDFDSTIGIHPSAAEEFVTMRS
ncbi:MAG: glutathione-disulfide reductase [Candidatus Puniceispirillales bacterium]|jgi:glutathione reductase (NADPH)|nr:glutathione-disulfide reductase [Pseudomonadota bacterium]